VIHNLPETFANLLSRFAPVFSGPSFANFVVLVSSWLSCVGRRSISRVIGWSGEGVERAHHSVYYRFFSRAVWSTDGVGRVLCGLALQLIHDADVHVLLDDTLCKKSGPHLWGAGMHHDPQGSNYVGNGRGRVAMAFGHCFVIASLWVPLPWNRERGLAVPIAVRLYRAKRRCPAEEYRKRSELGSQLVEQVRSWVPRERRLIVVADTEYACQTTVQNLPDGVDLVGPMNMKAAFFALPPAPVGRGRPRKKGERLPSPAQLVADDSTPWERRSVVLYGRRVDVLTKTAVGLWYRVAGSRPVRMLVTRDPRGRIAERAYFSTDPQMSVDHVARSFSRRWSAEVLHRDVKQHLGLGEAQNGWWRRPAKERRSRNAPGPQPHQRRGKLAAGRTVPFVLFTYAIVVLWYLRHGQPADDVARVRARMPWYRHKEAPSFADMLAAARRELWVARFSATPTPGRGERKSEDALLDLLLTA
jgi:hypothetical protein